MRAPLKVLAASLTIAVAGGGCGDGTLDPDPPVATVVVSGVGDTLRTLGEAGVLTATALDASGRSIAGKAFAWSTSAPGVVAVDSAGAITALTNGAAVITATTDAVRGVASLVVAQAVATVNVSGPIDTVRALGETTQYIAQGLDANANPVPGVTFVWSSSDTAVVVVQQDGTAVARGTGRAVVHARAGPVQGGQVLIVTQEIARIALLGPTDTVLALGVVRVFSAEVLDANDNAIEGLSPTWASSDTGVATVSGSGAATSRGNGTAVITVSLDGTRDSIDMIVAQQITEIVITPDTSVFVEGDTVRLNAEPKDANGYLVQGVSAVWSVSDSSVLRVDTMGLAVGMRHGAVVVYANAAQQTASVQGRVVLRFAAVRAGFWHTCALATSGNAYCWGFGRNGPLGTGSTENQRSPARVIGGLTFVEVTVGQYFSCGRTTEGLAYCWGLGDEGQIGNGATLSDSVPVPVAGGLAFSAMASGDSHTCALASTGTLCWGENRKGDLGNDPAVTGLAVSTPLAISTDPGLVSFVAGYWHTCGLTQDGAAYCWGTEQSFRPDTTLPPLSWTAEPQLITGGLTFGQLSAGYNHTCGVASGNELYCWGSGGYGELGLGAVTAASSPTRVASNLLFVSVSGRVWHTCAVTTDGEAYCWGLSLYGDLGAAPPDTCDTNQCSLTPLAVAGGITFSTISAGAAHTCGLTPDGLIYCWGQGSRLGNGSTDDQSIPTLVDYQQ